MNIRHAHADDLGRLTEIYNQAISIGQRTADTTPLSVKERQPWFDDHQNDKYPLFVAEENGIIMGYLTISPYRPGREALRFTAEVSYYIHFDHHRKGVGSSLLDHAIAVSPSLEIKTLFAILLDTNEGSRGLLESRGFERWGHLPGIADFDGTELGQYYYGLRLQSRPLCSSIQGSSGQL